MADRRSGPGEGDDADADATRGPTRRAPRWVKAFGVIVGVLVLLAVVLQVVGGGEHGPARHTSSGDADIAQWAIAPVHAPPQTNPVPFQPLHG